MADSSTTSDTGAYAVYDVDLQRYVSGVSDKASTDKSRKALGSEGITKGHQLETRAV